MSSNSVFGQATHPLTHLTDYTHPLTHFSDWATPGGPDPGPLGHTINDYYDSLTKKPPGPNSAGDPPQLGASTIDALNAQLAQELQMRASRTLMTNPTEAQSPLVQSAGAQLMGR